MLKIILVALSVHYLLAFTIGGANITVNEFNVISIFILSLFILLLATVEEYLFRHLVIDFVGYNLKGAIFSSIVFSLLHISNSGFYTMALLNTFVLGMLLAFIRMRGNLQQCIFIHFLWNWIVFVLLTDNLSGISSESFSGYVSGLVDTGTITSINYNSQYLGGNYGIENSPILFFLLTSLAFLFYKKQNFTSLNEAFK